MEYISLMLTGMPSIQKICNRLEYHYPLGKQNQLTFANQVTWVDGNAYLSAKIPHPGAVIITEVDSVNHFISGRFSGQLLQASGEDTIRITQGIFYRVKMGD